MSQERLMTPLASPWTDAMGETSSVIRGDVNAYF
jgi:hypothetical protein